MWIYLDLNINEKHFLGMLKDEKATVSKLESRISYTAVSQIARTRTDRPLSTKRTQAENRKQQG